MNVNKTYRSQVKYERRRNRQWPVRRVSLQARAGARVRARAAERVQLVLLHQRAELFDSKKG